MSKELEYFLMDLIARIKEDAFDAKKEYNNNKDKNKADFLRGIIFGYWETLNSIKHQLIVFQINPKKVKFDFDPDKELLVGDIKKKK